MYVPSTKKIICSYDVVFDESLSNELAYMSQPFSEAMAIHPSVTYTPCAMSSREQTGDIIKVVYEHIIFFVLGTYTRYHFWCCGIPTNISQKPFCDW